MKTPPPGFRVLESSTSRVAHFDTESQEYLTWLLAPTGRDRVQDYIAKAGGYQYDLVRIAMRLIPQNGLFLDVGASIGPWALVVAKARRDVTVEAFEPDWQLFHGLSANIFLNGLENVHAHRFGLGAREASRRLHLPDSGNRASATFIPGSGRAMEVLPIARLDDLMLKPHVMKLSVEGFEHEVLEGGSETIRASAPILFFQSWDPAVRGSDFGPRRAALFSLIEIALCYDVRQLSGEHFIAYPHSRYAEVEAAVAANI